MVGASFRPTTSNSGQIGHRCTRVGTEGRKKKEHSRKHSTVPSEKCLALIFGTPDAALTASISARIFALASFAISGGLRKGNSTRDVNKHGQTHQRYDHKGCKRRLIPMVCDKRAYDGWADRNAYQLRATRKSGHLSRRIRPRYQCKLVADDQSEWTDD